MSDFFADSYYSWTFVADSGDFYAGFTFHDTGAYVPGQVFDGNLGYYAITGAYDYGVDLGVYGYNEGLTYTTVYYDAFQGYLQTYNYAYEGKPSSYWGLGYEFDYAWNGVAWDEFGYAGAYQAGYYG
jgi:hypothetical protein